MYELKKREKTELAIYKALGVRLFQKFVFAIERYKHRKDGGYNSNYHIRRISGEGVSGHYAYLSFNAFLHITSIIFITLHVLILRAADIPWIGAVYTYSLILIIGNLYCIMLQRYNALRIRKSEGQYRERYQKKIIKNASLLSGNASQIYTYIDPAADMEYLIRMKNSLTDGENFIIRKSDRYTLERLAEWKRASKIVIRSRPRERDLPSALYTRIDLQVRWLQNIFRRKTCRVLQTYAVIAEESTGEKAFADLFEDDSRESVLEMIDSFLLALEQSFDVRRKA